MKGDEGLKFAFQSQNPCVYRHFTRTDEGGRVFAGSIFIITDAIFINTDAIKVPTYGTIVPCLGHICAI